MKPLLKWGWNSPTLTTWGSFATRAFGLTAILMLAVRRFSPAETNVWQLFGTIIAFQLLADLGFTQTFIRTLAFARAGASDLGQPPAGTRPEPNWELIRRIHGTMRHVYARLALVVLLGLTLLGTLALVRPIGFLSEPAPAWFAWGLVVVATSTTFYTNCDSALLQGLGHIALLRRWETAIALAASITGIGVLLAGGNLLALIVSSQTWVFVAAWRNRRLSRNVLAGTVAGHGHLANDPAVFAHVWPRVWRSGVGLLCYQGMVQGSGLVYAQVASAGASASYQLCLRLFQMLSQFSQAPFYSRIPLLATLRAQGDHESFACQAVRGMRLALLAFSSGALLGGFLGPVFFAWVGSQTPFPPPMLWAVFSLAFLLERHGAMHLQLYSTTDHIVWHVANGVTAGICLACTTLLARPLGPLAFPVALTAACALFFVPYCAWRSHRLLGGKVLAFETKAMALPLILTASYLGYVLF